MNLTPQPEAELPTTNGESNSPISTNESLNTEKTDKEKVKEMAFAELKIQFNKIIKEYVNSPEFREHLSIFFSKADKPEMGERNPVEIFSRVIKGIINNIDISVLDPKETEAFLSKITYNEGQQVNSHLKERNRITISNLTTYVHSLSINGSMQEVYTIGAVGGDHVNSDPVTRRKNREKENGSIIEEPYDISKEEDIGLVSIGTPFPNYFEGFEDEYGNPDIVLRSFISAMYIKIISDVIQNNPEVKKLPFLAATSIELPYQTSADEDNAGSIVFLDTLSNFRKTSKWASHIKKLYMGGALRMTYLITLRVGKISIVMRAIKGVTTAIMADSIMLYDYKIGEKDFLSKYYNEVAPKLTQLLNEL